MRRLRGMRYGLAENANRKTMPGSYDSYQPSFTTVNSARKQGSDAHSQISGVEIVKGIG